MSLKTLLFKKKTYWSCHNKLFTHAKSFHRVFTVDCDRIKSRLIYDNEIFCICFQLMFTEMLLRYTDETACLIDVSNNAPRNRFTLLNSLFDRLFNTVWHSESSSAVTLLLHADWVMLKNASNQGGANSVTVALGKRNLGHGCWSLRKLQFPKIIWQLALGF